jgi:oxygen-dependent protoporphyrinogen oxidase
MAPVVIGAGITGLVAAFEMVKRGERPLIIEPGRVGGMIRSLTHEGFTLEAGPNVIVERPDLAALLKELGLTSAIRYPIVKNYGQYVWARDKVRKVPAGLRELVSSPLFSLGTKLSLPFKLLKPGLLRPHGEDTSVLEFFSPLLGERTTKEMLDPVLKGIYGGDVEKLSARTIFPGLWKAAVEGLSLLGYMKSRPKGGKPSVLVIEGGIETLVRALLERLENEGVEIKRCAVEAIQKTASGFSLACSDGSEVQTDQCVVTLAGDKLSALMPPLDAKLAARLQTMRYASLGVVHASVPRTEQLISNAFGVLFPAGMPDDLLGVMFNSLLFPHVAPPDRHILTLIVGGAQATGRPDETRLRQTLPELMRSLLGINGFEWIKLTEWNNAIPQLVVGHHQVVAACDECERNNPGMVLAGVQRGGVGVSDRIRMAREAVDRLFAPGLRQAA